jgi:hypothetical protein
MFSNFRNFGYAQYVEPNLSGSLHSVQCVALNETVEGF